VTAQVPNLNPAAGVGEQPAPAPTPPGGPVVGEPIPEAQSLDDLNPEQLDALAARIATARENRPQSITDALNALQEQLTTTHRQKDEVVGERKQASQQADVLEQSIADIKRSLRRTELVEAATVAGFAQPLVAADHLLTQDGDVSDLVTKLAGSGAFVMKQPKQSASIGGPNSKPAPELPAGIQGLVDEINAAHGRT
jgi:hypothetical protein